LTVSLKAALKAVLRTTLTATLGLTAGAALASGHITALHWDAQGRFEHRVQIAPGRFAEVCGALQTSRAVTWRFEGADVLDFNIHYHAGQDTVYPERRAAIRAGEGRLQPALDETYCWMWTNKTSAPVALGVTLQR
jgi:hypothetical protein